MSADLREFDLHGRAFEQKARLMNVVEVQLDDTFLKHTCDARELSLRPGDSVVVETSRGPTVGTVQSHVQRRLVENAAIDSVLRRATDQDAETQARHRQMELDAYRFAIERVRGRKLPMKLIRAQWMHDGSKLVFYFSAEGRIDFRDLVKDLAHRFRARIEMHQIGVRDGARMLGGIGPCGRELCCSTFLENFAPVSIRMAKDQGLTLNPAKVSGMCGRLMCCLVYEQQLYRSMRKRVPRAGRRVRTRLGEGDVIDVDIINQRVSVELPDGSRKLFPVAEVIEVGKDSPDAYVDDGLAGVEYIWDLEEERPKQSSASKRGPGDDATPRKRRRRRRGKRRGGGSDGKSE